MQVTKFLKFKELFLLLFIVILCTGCTSEIYYNFGEDGIDSKITIKYNVNEYTKYVNDTDEEFNVNRTYTSYQVKTGSEKLFDQNKINRFANIDTVKYSGKLTQNNNDFVYEYTYKYKYNEFKNNNIFNNCFSIKFIREDDNAYYYSLSGYYTCRYVKNMQFKVEAKDRLLNTNSKNIEGDTATWTIDQEDNNIYFAISKDKVGNGGNGWYIAAGVIVGILLVVTLFLYKKINQY